MSAKKIRSKKSIVLLIDVISIILSFVLALVIRFRFLVASFGSHLVLSTYIPFFFMALIIYIVVSIVMKEIRIDKMSRKEIVELTVVHQLILSMVYIYIFFLFHRTNVISRIAILSFFGLNVVLSIMGRLCYHHYCLTAISAASDKKVKTKEKTAAGKQSRVRHIYIVGSKSIGQYGGYESFVMNLLLHHKDNKNIQYHVACKANGEGYMEIDKLPGAKRINDKEFAYCNAQCFLIKVPDKIGSAQAIYYDLRALRWCCEHIEKNHIDNPIVYILASRVGPFEKRYVKRIHNYGGMVLQNPDGWEHERRKWNVYIRKYWKFSEKYAVKNADLVVCDSKHIESYIQDEYSYYNPKTTFIAYGSYVTGSSLSDDDPVFAGWLKDHDLRDKQHYISVGRFVPENNFDIMIREFMLSKSDKDFALITTDNPKYAEELQQKYQYRNDRRIKFVGTVYDAELLKKIRENACGYLHGHEVGGTNPSLLESLGSTKVNLLYDVGFNREVAEEAALYWSKTEGSLSRAIEKADSLSEKQRDEMGKKAKQRIIDEYSWQAICDRYLDVFLK